MSFVCPPYCQQDEGVKAERDRLAAELAKLSAVTMEGIREVIVSELVKHSINKFLADLAPGLATENEQLKAELVKARERIAQLLDQAEHRRVAIDHELAQIQSSVPQLSERICALRLGLSWHPSKGGIPE